MSCNEGVIERAVRIAAALALLTMALFHVVSGTLAILFYVLSGVAFVTGVIGYCPAWAIFGISTCGAKHVPAKAGGPGQ